MNIHPTFLCLQFQAAISILKQELSDEAIQLAEAQDMAVKVLSKSLDMNKLTSEKVEMATLTRINNKTVIKILTNVEVDALIAKYEKIEAELEAAKKEKLQQKS